MNKESLWIVIEGPDGAGKSTLCKNLQMCLTFRNPTHIVEAPNKAMGFYSQIKHALTQSGETYGDILQYCMIGNYQQTLKDLIIPKLEEGINVISDRWIPSTIIYNILDKGMISSNLINLSSVMHYQGIEDSRFIRGDKFLDMGRVNEILSRIPNHPIIQPDLVIYLIPSDDLLKENIEKRKGISSDINDLDLDRLLKAKYLYNKMALNAKGFITMRDHCGQIEVEFASPWLQKRILYAEGTQVYFKNLLPDSIEAIKDAIKRKESPKK